MLMNILFVIAIAALCYCAFIVGKALWEDEYNDDPSW